jgi:hypothetical protein
MRRKLIAPAMIRRVLTTVVLAHTRPAVCANTRARVTE